jgi:hypothetical protein
MLFDYQLLVNLDSQNYYVMLEKVPANNKKLIYKRLGEYDLLFLARKNPDFPIS